MPAKNLTRDDVRIEPWGMNVYDGRRCLGEVYSSFNGWSWYHADDRGDCRTSEAAIRAVIRAENARRKGD